jgi:hypothetical protein
MGGFTQQQIASLDGVGAIPADPGILPGETVCEDEYPVYAGYIYVADGSPWMSPMTGTVADIKRRYGYSEIRRCELVKRGSRTTSRRCAVSSVASPTQSDATVKFYSRPCGKIPHRRRRGAVRQKLSLECSGLERTIHPMFRLEVYRCPACGHWHIGHSWKRPTKARKAL